MFSFNAEIKILIVRKILKIYFCFGLKGSVHQGGPWGHMICNFKNGVEWNQFQNANLSWLGINPPKPLTLLKEKNVLLI